MAPTMYFLLPQVNSSQRLTTIAVLVDGKLKLFNTTQLNSFLINMPTPPTLLFCGST